MKRTYTLKKRAEKQADTRLRIAEAAIELHRTIGPANTTLSMVAERAGVQRHTLYAHFPDERSLQQACSGLHLERNPLPDAEPWRAISSPKQRLESGIGEIYRWYERNSDIAGCVLRDAEFHAPTRETAEQRFGPAMAAYAEVLAEGISPASRPMLGVALSFYTWRTLVIAHGQTTESAARMMVAAILEQ